jgi:hypothetical protein
VRHTKDSQKLWQSHRAELERTCVIQIDSAGLRSSGFAGPCVCLFSENEIVLSDEFFGDVITHSIPTDLEAAKALSSSPAALDLFMWLSYR